MQYQTVQHRQGDDGREFAPLQGGGGVTLLRSLRDRGGVVSHARCGRSRGRAMAGEELTSTEGEERDIGDPWEEVLDRLGTEPDSEGRPATEPAPDGEHKRGARLSHPVRWAAAVTLALFSLALACVVLPGVVGGDSTGSSRGAPSTRSTYRAIRPPASRRGRRIITPRRRPGKPHRAKPPAAMVRRRPRHTPPRAFAPSSEQQWESEPSAPVAPPSTPEEAPMPSTPAPESALGAAAPSPPGATVPGKGLRDGSRSSPEFGL
jgi:hypothetical protein